MYLEGMETAVVEGIHQSGIDRSEVMVATTLDPPINNQAVIKV